MHDTYDESYESGNLIVDKETFELKNRDVLLEVRTIYYIILVIISRSLLYQKLQLSKSKRANTRRFF